MRAIYLDFVFEVGIDIELAGKDAHHLLNVIRAKKDDRLMLLNGNGLKGLATVKSCSKREIKLQCESVELVSRGKTRFSLGIGKLKKEAMDDVLKASCELGMATIYIMKTDRSQKYDINKERVKKILISGIEQSNNSFLPEVIEVGLSDMPWDEFDEVALFTLLEGQKSMVKPNPKERNNLILIGPEGGFTDREVQGLPDAARTGAICFDLPILRAPTAFKCALGYLQAYC